MTPPDQPDPQMIAEQLRKPSGEAADNVGDKMDQVNEPLFALTLAAMRPAAHERILEIGFGTGTYLSRLYDEADKLEVHGIDYSPEMVARATRCNAALVDSGRLHLVTGASDDLPFADQHFDKVFCNMVVYFWDRPEAHLSEVRRVLKPGGHFYIGIRTNESMLQFPFVQYGFVLRDPEEWAQLLEQNGFACREAGRQHDPILQGDDGSMQLESVCLDAVRR